MKVTRSYGFTLVEVLLAVVIFSVVGLSLYGSFAAGTRLNRKLESTLRLQRDAVWTLERIARDMENMVDYDFRNSYPELKSFSVEPGSVAFLVPSEQGLKAVRYQLQRSKNGEIRETRIGSMTRENVAVTEQKTIDRRENVMVREEQDFFSFVSKGFEGAAAEVLLKPLVDDSFKISFLQSQGQEQSEGEWSETWERGIPRGARILLTIDDGNAEKTFQRVVLVPQGNLPHEK